MVQSSGGFARFPLMLLASSRRPLAASRVTLAASRVLGRPPRAYSTPALEYASECWLPTTWTPLTLTSRVAHTHDTSLLDFALPHDASLDLPVCACILLRAPGRGRGEGPANEDAVRPYTPVSDSSLRGKFQLLVKRYAGGAASEYLHELPVGAAVDFRHVAFNLKAQYPFGGKQRITMLAGGTGITPMFQALRKLMGTPGDTREVTLVYSNKSEEDILLRAELEAWAKTHAPRFKLVYVLGETASHTTSADWSSTDVYTATSGWIDQAKVAQFCHPPSEETMVMVCGVPAMYEALCGPRQDRALAKGSVLEHMGYSDTMVAKM